MKKIISWGLLFSCILGVTNSAKASVVGYIANIDTDPQTVDAGVLSAPINIHLDPVAETGGLDFVLSTTNTDTSSYYFTNANASDCTTVLVDNIIHMNAGTANKRFCYFDLTPGVYTLSATNLTSTTATQDITISGSISDTTPPTVTLSTPTEGSVFGSSDVSYSFNFTDDVDETINCALYLNDEFSGNILASNGAEYSSVYAGVSDGINSLFISCIDLAGNEGRSNKNSFTVDTMTDSTEEPRRIITGGSSHALKKKMSEIPGCDAKTDGHSTITGESCASNVPHEEAWVLGAEKFVFSMFLKREPPPYSKGDHANEVLELQKFLNANGYASGPEDGKFGPITEGAVVRFQLANGLTGDGIVGPLTLALLNK